MEPHDTWGEWSKHVLIELKRLDNGIKELTTLMIEHKTEIAVIKAKTALIGACFGAVPGLIFFLLSHFGGKG